MSSLLIDERNKLIGENLRKYRLLKGLTQDELAEGICSVSQLSKVENGKTYLKRDLLKQMAHRLGVSIERVESQDAMLEELSEQLQTAQDAMKAQKNEFALDYASKVKSTALEFGYISLVIKAVKLENHVLLELKRYQEAIDVVEELLKTQVEVEEIDLIDLHIQLGYSYEITGDRLSAHRYYTMADDAFMNVDAESTVRLRVYFGLARCHFFLHNNRMAYRFYEMTEALAEQLTMHLWRIRAKYMKATMLKRMGEWERAEELFLSVLKEAEENSLLLDIGYIHNNMGQLFQDRGEYGQAKVHYNRALQVWKLLNEEVLIHEALLNSAEIALIEGQLRYAEELVKEVFSIVEKHPIPTYSANAKAHRIWGWIMAQHGQFDQYFEHLQQSIEIYAKHEMPLEACETARELAESCYQKGDPRAVELFRQAMSYNELYIQFGKWR